MDDVTWFDSYSGPKSLMAANGQATCWLGFNISTESGGVTGRDISVIALTLFEVLAEARRQYESTTDRLTESVRPAERLQ